MCDVKVKRPRSERAWNALVPVNPKAYSLPGDMALEDCGDMELVFAREVHSFICRGYPTPALFRLLGVDIRIDLARVEQVQRVDYVHISLRTHRQPWTSARHTCALDCFHEANGTKTELFFQVSFLAETDTVLATTGAFEPDRTMHHLVHAVLDDVQLFGAGEQRERVHITVADVAKVAGYYAPVVKVIGRLAHQAGQLRNGNAVKV